MDVSKGDDNIFKVENENDFWEETKNTFQFYMPHVDVWSPTDIYIRWCVWKEKKMCVYCLALENDFVLLLCSGMAMVIICGLFWSSVTRVHWTSVCCYFRRKKKGKKKLRLYYNPVYVKRYLF